jgi:hypothetical protein
MKVAPTLLSDVEGQAFARRYRSDVLFPSPQDDRLLHALLKNGIQGLEVYG